MAIRHITENSANEVINSLKVTSDELFHWFEDSQMKPNTDRCHLLTSSSDEVSICIDKYNIKINKCERLLGIKIDEKTNFNIHFDEICKKAGQKLNVLSRVTP